MTNAETEDLYGRLFAIETTLSRLMTEQIRSPDGNMEREQAILAQMTQNAAAKMSPTARESATLCLQRILSSADEYAEFLDQLDETGE